MKTAIHQPNFLPWTGYFLKMALSDVFVFHDNVQITKSGPTRRVKIAANHTADQTQWLTVPLKKHSDFTLIRDLEISDATDWRKKHLNMISTVYHKYPFFGQIYPQIKSWYQQSEIYTNLSDMNIFFIKNIATELDLMPGFSKSSEIPVEGKGSEYNLNIVRYCNGTNYISGKGGDNYQDEPMFSITNVELSSYDFKGMCIEIFSFSDKNVNLSRSIIELMMFYGNQYIAQKLQEKL